MPLPPTRERVQSLAGGVGVALPQLVVVAPRGEALLSLSLLVRDSLSAEYSFFVQTLPATGALHQLSQVFSQYGYEPKHGAVIAVHAREGGEVRVTDPLQRVLYRRPQSQTQILLS